MEGGVWQELKIILIIVISVSAVYLLYWSVHERWINKLPLEHSPKGLGIFLLDIVLFLIVTCIAIFVVVEIVKWQGTNFLQRGVIVGTLVPVLAVILEAAVELGRPTMFWLEELAEVVLRLFRHGPRLLSAAIKRYQNSKRANRAAALMLMMLVGAASAFAAEQPIARLFPEHGSKLADFAVERQGTSGHLEVITPDASGTLFVGDVVRAIREGAAATVRSIATRASIARVTYDYPIKIVGEGTSPPSQPGMWTLPGTSYSANEIQSDQVRASKMLGSSVYDIHNRGIGSLKDLVIGKDGKVAAAVVDVGTFLGMGGKYVAVPLSDLKTDNNRLTLDMTKEQLQQAQGYNLENRNTGAGSSTSPVTGGHIGSSTGTR